MPGLELSRAEDTTEGIQSGMGGGSGLDPSIWEMLDSDTA